MEVGRGMGLLLAKRNFVLVCMSPVTCAKRIYFLPRLELYHRKPYSVLLSWWGRERQYVIEENSPCNTGKTYHLSS